MEEFRKTRTELPASYDYLYENRAYFGCNFSFGGMPQDKVLQSMRLFAKEVMPAFK